jgi:hypothetical protein
MAAHADAALLLEEPHGAKGNFNPTGHAAVYLTNICAASPTQLRICAPGEGGVVVGRYKQVSQYDWLAIPLLGYLYSVDSIEEIPQKADEQSVAELRDRYRREHLLDLIPDDTKGRAPKGDWVQLVGAAYVRRIYGFEIETTPEQDAAFIEQWNRRQGRAHFNILFHNCADFSADVLNFYQPHSIARNYFADAGIMTPKQVARSLARHARRHPEWEFSAFYIPQVPGRIARSTRVDGVAETILKSKKYVVPLAIFHPVVTGTIVVAYIMRGRFDPKHDAKGAFDISRAFQPAQSRTGSASSKIARQRGEPGEP